MLSAALSSSAMLGLRMAYGVGAVSDGSAGAECRGDYDGLGDLGVGRVSFARAVGMDVDAILTLRRTGNGEIIALGGVVKG